MPLQKPDDATVSRSTPLAARYFKAGPSFPPVDLMQIKAPHRKAAKIDLLRLSPLQTAGCHQRPAFFYAVRLFKTRCRAARQSRHRSEASAADIQALRCQQQGH